jgi:hypothetical protein
MNPTPIPRPLGRPQIPAGAYVLAAGLRLFACSRTQVRSAPVLAENCGRNRALRTGVLMPLDN